MIKTAVEGREHYFSLDVFNTLSNPSGCLTDEIIDNKLLELAARFSHVPCVMLSCAFNNKLLSNLSQNRKFAECSLYLPLPPSAGTTVGSWFSDSNETRPLFFAANLGYHWILVAAQSQADGTVLCCYFDSCHASYASGVKRLHMVMTSLFVARRGCESEKVIMHIVSVQQQLDATSCGLRVLFNLELVLTNLKGSLQTVVASPTLFQEGYDDAAARAQLLAWFVRLRAAEGATTFYMEEDVHSLETEDRVARLISELAQNAEWPFQVALQSIVEEYAHAVCHWHLLFEDSNLAKDKLADPSSMFLRIVADFRNIQSQAELQGLVVKWISDNLRKECGATTWSEVVCGMGKKGVKAVKLTPKLIQSTLFGSIQSFPPRELMGLLISAFAPMFQTDIAVLYIDVTEDGAVSLPNSYLIVSPVDNSRSGKGKRMICAIVHDLNGTQCFRFGAEVLVLPAPPSTTTTSAADLPAPTSASATGVGDLEQPDKNVDFDEMSQTGELNEAYGRMLDSQTKPSDTVISYQSGAKAGNRREVKQIALLTRYSQLTTDMIRFCSFSTLRDGDCVPGWWSRADILCIEHSRQRALSDIPTNSHCDHLCINHDGNKENYEAKHRLFDTINIRCSRAHSKAEPQRQRKKNSKSRKKPSVSKREDHHCSCPFRAVWRKNCSYPGEVPCQLWVRTSSTEHCKECVAYLADDAKGIVNGDIPLRIRAVLAANADTVPFNLTWRVTERMCTEEPELRTYTFDQLLYCYRKHYGPAPFKATPVAEAIAHLQMLRESEPSFYFYYHELHNGIVDVIYWRSASDLSAYSSFHYVIEEDNTYNCIEDEGYKFKQFVTQSAHGRTLNLGQAVMLSEDIASHCLVYEAFLLSMGGQLLERGCCEEGRPWRWEPETVSLVMPQCMKIDGDAAAEGALRLVFGDALVIVWCRVHLSRNLMRRARFPGYPVLREGLAALERFEGTSWDRAQFEKEFDQEQARLMAPLAVLRAARDASKKSRRKDAADIFDYMDYRLSSSNRAKWVRHYLTAFIGSSGATTNVVESHHSVFKAMLRTAGDIIKCIDTTRHLSVHCLKNSSVRLHLRNAPEIPRQLAFIVPHLSVKNVLHLISIYSRAQDYLAVEDKHPAGEVRQFTVTYISNKKQVSHRVKARTTPFLDYNTRYDSSIVCALCSKGSTRNEWSACNTCNRWFHVNCGMVKVSDTGEFVDICSSCRELPAAMDCSCCEPTISGLPDVHTLCVYQTFFKTAQLPVESVHPALLTTRTLSPAARFAFETAIMEPGYNDITIAKDYSGENAEAAVARSKDAFVELLHAQSRELICLASSLHTDYAMRTLSSLQLKLISEMRGCIKQRTTTADNVAAATKRVYQSEALALSKKVRVELLTKQAEAAAGKGQGFTNASGGLQLSQSAKGKVRSVARLQARFEPASGKRKDEEQHDEPAAGSPVSSKRRRRLHRVQSTSSSLATSNTQSSRGQALAGASALLSLREGHDLDMYDDE